MWWAKSAICSARPKPPRRSRMFPAAPAPSGPTGPAAGQPHASAAGVPWPAMVSPPIPLPHSAWGTPSRVTRRGARPIRPGLRLMRVVGQSMAPLLNHGELVLVHERAFERRSPCRGDLVAARPSSLGGKAVIKRLARRHGEQFFLLGENLERSFDSRWFGPVTREELIGRVWARLWPWKVLITQAAEEETR